MKDEQRNPKDNRCGYTNCLREGLDNLRDEKMRQMEAASGLDDAIRAGVLAMRKLDAIICNKYRE